MDPTLNFRTSGSPKRFLAMLSAVMLSLFAVTSVAHAAPTITMPPVTWQEGNTPTTLTSEDAVLAARDAGMMTLEMTDIVVNCPVVVTPWGQIPNAVRHSGTA